MTSQYTPLLHLPPGDYRDYYRISQDQSGVQIGTTRQQSDLRPSVEGNPGVRVVGTYVDPDVSATKANVVRPEFERLLQDLRPGENILCWHSDRVIRTMGDLMRVINTGAYLYSLHAGHFDLSTPAGIAVAQTVTAWAEYEGKQKALRQKSSHHQRALSGRPFLGGATPYGFDKINGELCTNQQQAALLAEMYDWALVGISLSAIAARLNEAGHMTSQGSRGRPWTGTSVKNVLTAPRNAGIVVYNGEEVAHGTWTPIVNESKFRTVVRMLNDPSRRTAGPRDGRGGVHHPLIGIVKCSVCDQTARGAAFHVGTDREYRVYRCVKGHGSARADWLEDLVASLIIKRVNEPVSERLAQTPDIEPLQAQLVQLRDKGIEFLDMLDNGEMDRAEFAVVNKRNKARITAVERQIKLATTATALHMLLDVDDMEVHWLASTAKERNAFARAFIDSIVIKPRGQSAKRNLPGHAEIWVTGEEEPWIF